MKVYQYAIREGMQEVQIHEGARLLTAYMREDGQPVVSALVDDARPLRNHRVLLVREALEFTHRDGARWIGVIQIKALRSFHVFDCGEVLELGGADEDK